MLDIIKLNSLIFNQFFYKKDNNTNVYIKTFTIKSNLAKNLIKKMFY